MNQNLGILGGGQLGRMLALAARPMGIGVTVVDPSRDAPAGPLANHLVADYDDAEALALLARSNCITFEFENVPDAAATQLASARPVFPPPRALSVAQDRLYEKRTFDTLGIETPRYAPVDSLEDAERAYGELGAVVLKTRRFGYDGKGQAVVREKSELAAAYQSLAGAPCIAEELVKFERELSVLICRGRDGESVIYPLTENLHREGILRRSVAPAPEVTGPLEQRAHTYARALVEDLEYVGVLALELFQVNGRLLANEFAPRVHNSGHWTIEGARTSQFENHVRAVMGLPLGSSTAIEHSVMVNLIGSIPPASEILAIEDAHLHDYAKIPRAGRKVGHVTVRAASAAKALEKARAVEQLLGSGPQP